MATAFKFVWCIVAEYSGLSGRENAHLEFPKTDIFPDELKTCRVREMSKIFNESAWVIYPVVLLGSQKKTNKKTNKGGIITRVENKHI